MFFKTKVIRISSVTVEIIESSRTVKDGKAAFYLKSTYWCLHLVSDYSGENTRHAVKFIFYCYFEQ